MLLGGGLVTLVGLGGGFALLFGGELVGELGWRERLTIPGGSRGLGGCLEVAFVPGGKAARKLVRLLQLEAHLAAVLVAFGPVEIESFDHIEGIDAFAHEGH